MQENSRGTILLLWSHLGLNQGPPDYESGATNQLSYGTSRASANIFYFIVYLGERFRKGRGSDP